MYDALSRGDLDRAVEYLDSEVEVRPALEPLEHGSRIHGRDGVRAFFADLGQWDSMRVELEEIIESGDRVLLHERWHFRGSQGIELDVAISDLFTFRGGLVVRVEGFRDKAEALATLDL